MKRAFAAAALALGGLAALGLVPASVGNPPAVPEPRFVEALGNRLRVVQAGSGPDLLLVHGCPGSIEDFDPVFAALAAKYRVTAYDRPGHGYSDGKGNEFSLDYNARVAEELIAKLQLREPVWVGHSYGASAGLAAAVRGKSPVRSYVLIASPGYRPVNVDKLSYLLGIPLLGDGLSKTLAPLIGPRFIRSRLANGFKPNQDAISAEQVEQRVALWSNPRIPVTRAKEILNLERDLDALSPHYGSIRKKVFLVQGKDDWITRAAWKLKEDIPGSELIELERVGHFPQFAKPEAVIAAIERASLAEAPGEAGR